MANPWSSSVEDIALKPLRSFLDSDQKILSVARAEEKLDNDPEDLVTKLRLADQKTAEYYSNSRSGNHSNIKPEIILANDLARELTSQLKVLHERFKGLDSQDSLKLALLDAIKACSAHKEELSVVNRAKLLECLRSSIDLIPKVYKRANKIPEGTSLIALNRALEILQSNDDISQENMYEYIQACIRMFEALYQQ